MTKASSLFFSNLDSNYTFIIYMWLPIEMFIVVIKIKI
jgi:hypothetical protein